MYTVFLWHKIKGSVPVQRIRNSHLKRRHSLYFYTALVSDAFGQSRPSKQFFFFFKSYTKEIKNGTPIFRSSNNLGRHRRNLMTRKAKKK